jgi:3-methyladenine DNA glycosylase/8-oxoguanine DNA glycosylase
MATPRRIDTAKATLALRRADSVLGNLMKLVGPFDLQVKHTSTVFAVLSEAIVYQQLTGRAAETIHTRVLAACGADGDGLTAERVLATTDETLRGAGLSRAKVASLRDLALHDRSGSLPALPDIDSMDDLEVVERFTAVRGIGRWTAHMFLIFRLGRPDVLPVDDYGVRRAFGLVYEQETPTPKQLAAHGERWAPYRTVASWYLWRALELP